MAWQQRSYGHQYNSNSGHALFVGSKTRKPIALSIKSKICNACSAWPKSKQFVEGFNVPLHYCTKNWTGTSGAMEAQACLDMTVDLYENKMCTIDCICIDDDTSTRSLMKWSNADWMMNKKSATPPTSEISKGPNKGKMQVRPDRGKLPPHIPEPVFAADLNHRRKVFTGELYAMLSMKVKERCTLTTNDVLRLGKNYGYMIRGLNSVAGNEEAMINKGKAVIEHHFDNHEFCGPWCPRLRMSEEEKKASQRFYRDKEKDTESSTSLLQRWSTGLLN
jgi:hypothetical protein